MKKNLIILGLVLVTAIIFCNAASAATAPQPALSGKNTTDSAIDGHNMVYVYKPNFNHTNIHMKNLVTGSVNVVDTSYSQQDHPDISGGNVVYQRRDNNSVNWEIYYRNMSDPYSSVIRLVYNQNVNFTSPKISGNNVIFLASQVTNTGRIHGIYLKNLLTGSMTTVASGTSNLGGPWLFENPDIAGNYIVYTKYDGNYKRIYRTTTSATVNRGTPISYVPRTQNFPVVSTTGIVAWMEYWSTSGWDVVWAENILDANPILHSEWTNDNDTYPAISRNYLVWVNQNKDIYYLKDLRSQNQVTIGNVNHSYYSPTPAVSFDDHGIFVSYQNGTSTYWRNMDSIAPTIKTPVSGTTTSIARAQSIIITFSEPVKWGTKSIQVLVNGVALSSTAYTLSLSSDGKTLTIKPTALWPANSAIRVVLNAGCVKDYGGNSLIATSRAFKTEST